MCTLMTNKQDFPSFPGEKQFFTPVFYLPNQETERMLFFRRCSQIDEEIETDGDDLDSEMTCINNPTSNDAKFMKEVRFLFFSETGKPGSVSFSE